MFDWHQRESYICIQKVCVMIVMIVLFVLILMIEICVENSPSYSSMAWNGILTNMIGLLLCLYGGTIIYLVTKPEYQRRPLPEEQVINLSFDLASNN